MGLKNNHSKPTYQPGPLHMQLPLPVQLLPFPQLLSTRIPLPSQLLLILRSQFQHHSLQEAFHDYSDQLCPVGVHS